MMKNKRLEERRKKISKDIDIFVKQSFDIVDRIHEILEKQGKEQKDLAHLLGKSESEISKWMTGTHNFTLNTLAKIQAVLGESVIKVTNEIQNEKSFVIISYEGLELNESQNRSTPFYFKMNDNPSFNHILNDINRNVTIKKIVDLNINKSLVPSSYVYFLTNEKPFENSWEIDNPKNKQSLKKPDKTSKVATKMKLAIVNKSFQHSGY